MKDQIELKKPEGGYIAKEPKVKLQSVSCQDCWTAVNGFHDPEATLVISADDLGNLLGMANDVNHIVLNFNEATENLDAADRGEVKYNIVQSTLRSWKSTLTERWRRMQ